MNDRIKVLFLAADPFRTGTPLRLDEEARTVDQAIHGGRAGDRVELVPHFATRTRDLRDALLRHEPQIVHFAGHGDAPGLPPGFIYLGDEYGRPQPVGGDALARLFGVVKCVRVVVLNGCDTLATVEALSEVVDHAIGMSSQVSDASAIVFAEAFYGALAMGGTILDAFELAVIQLELEKNPSAPAPVLRSRPGADPGLPSVSKLALPERNPDGEQVISIGDAEIRKALFEAGGGTGKQVIGIDKLSSEDTTFRKS